MTLQQLLSPCRRAVDDYKMIENGDKIAVGLSGGKDSLTLLHLLCGLKVFYPNKFELVAITVLLGLKYNENELKAIKDECDKLNVKLVIIETDIAPIIFDERKEKNPCSLCSKMRRGALANAAIKEGCNKLALGHHADDLIETLFLSLFFEGRLSTFEPITFLSKTNMTVIRPMLYIEEKNVSAYAKTLPVLHNPCPADKHTRRQYIKDTLNSIKKDIPFAKDRILSAITNPSRNHLFDDAVNKYAVEQLKIGKNYIPNTDIYPLKNN